MAAPGAAQPPKPFPVLEYQIEGNTLLSTMDVEKAVLPYLGETRTIKDIEAARLQLENTYHDRGYKTVLVTIPQQQVLDGVVRLQVTEAAVGKLHVEGSRYHSIDRITHVNAMQQFQYDPFSTLGGRDACTVGALRKQAVGHDVSIRSTRREGAGASRTLASDLMTSTSSR